MYIVGSSLFVSIWGVLAMSVVRRVQMVPKCVLLFNEIVVLVAIVLFCLRPTV